MNKTPILTIALGASLIAVLAGCTTAATTPNPTSPASTSTQSPTPGPTITSTPDADYKAPSGTCENGEATIIQDVSDIALPEGCDIVNVLTNGSTVDLGPVKQLNIEGKDNTITVDKAENIGIFGTGNDITHGGEATIDDQGSGNKTTQK